MTADDVAWLIAQVDRLGLRELDFEDAGGRVILRQGVATRPSAPESKAAPGPVVPRNVIRSPGMGFFRASHPGDQSPGLQPGDNVENDAIVGYLDLSPGFEIVRAPARGRIARLIAQDGQLVGFGDPLYELG
ncbi:hypothetical protein QO058_20835 [Bosea vestrisii]|uniref:hypothetical protein n=1 Tax=Bosea vestrisii TaxID=151416 RepID=UPI0024DF4B08|nr:hypothetical protein [Bosea vestrisii]WID95219.1 hypothetical protein QO058_20835 [Bosea vestrisii]